MQRTYLIPEQDAEMLVRLANQIESKGRRLQAKLPAGQSVPAVTTRIVRTVEAAEEDGTVTRMSEVEINAPGAAQLSNHLMVAVIEHHRDADGSWKNIVRPVPGATFDINDPKQAWMWTAAPKCHYCAVNRTRNDTYVAMHRGTGALAQYGSDCLADATGVPGADALMAYLMSADTMLATAAQKAQAAHAARVASAKAGWRPFGEYVPTVEMVGHMVKTIREAGRFVSATDETRGAGLATWYKAVASFRQVHMRVPGAQVPTADDLELAREIVAWTAKEFRPMNDFGLNARHSIALDTIAVRSLALAAAMVNIALKARREAEASKVAPAPKVSTGQGQAGLWLPAGRELTVRTVWANNGRFPGMWYRLEDAAGNLYSWTDYGAKSGLSVGDTVVLVEGKVKGFKDIRGATHTEIAWVKFTKAVACQVA